MKKLPYIPDKKLYAAVMGACSWIRESGYFNKATQYYADKYNVNVEDVRKYVRIAQGNGQKQANNKRGTRKYRWYVVTGWSDRWSGDADVDIPLSKWDTTTWEKERKQDVFLFKAIDFEHMEKQIPKGKLGDDFRMYGYLLTDWRYREFGTEAEAKTFAESLIGGEVTA